jgi:hypothetical protein
MGCDGSKVVDVIDTKPQVPQEDIEFSDLETDTIRSTWPLLADDNCHTNGVTSGARTGSTSGVHEFTLCCSRPVF